MLVRRSRDCDSLLCPTVYLSSVLSIGFETYAEHGVGGVFTVEHRETEYFATFVLWLLGGYVVALLFLIRLCHILLHLPCYFLCYV